MSFIFRSLRGAFATKQSSPIGIMDCFASLAMTVEGSKLRATPPLLAARRPAPSARSFVSGSQPSIFRNSPGGAEVACNPGDDGSCRRLPRKGRPRLHLPLRHRCRRPRRTGSELLRKPQRPSSLLRRASALNFSSSSSANFFSKASSRLSNVVMAKFRSSCRIGRPRFASLRRGARMPK